ncbi:MAG: hypothetical protein ACO3AT_03115 [Ilumatobacteraceae bacterium]
MTVAGEVNVVVEVCAVGTVTFDSLLIIGTDVGAPAFSAVVAPIVSTAPSVNFVIPPIEVSKDSTDDVVCARSSTSRTE